MKYVKMLGLAAVGVAALMTFVGASTASATVLCKTKTVAGKCPVGWGYSGEIHAVSEGPLVFTFGFKNLECSESTVSGNTTEGTATATETPNGAITTLVLNNCNCTTVVVQKGNLEIHWIPPEPGKESTNGTLTFSGTTMTVNCSTIFGTVHCNYVTNNTDLGTVTGSSTTGGTATVDITAEIPRESTSSLCNETDIWHAQYKITTPNYLDVGEATG